MTRALAQTLMIVLHPQLATYHGELGFVLLDGRLEIKSTGYQSSPPSTGNEQPEDENKRRRNHRPPPIKVESYQTHIGGLMQAYSYNPGGIRANMSYVATRLEELMGIPTGSIDHAIRLAIACHDLGKLSMGWQQWAWEWEKLLEKEGYDISVLPQGPFFFAKTDFDYSKEQRTLQGKTKLKRPNHACESVMLGMSLIANSLGIEDGNTEGRLAPLLYAVCAAIARHHTPQAHEAGNVVLAQGAKEAVREVLEMVKQDATWQYDLSLLETESVEHSKVDGVVTTPKRGAQHELETWLYFVIVRALRLADQRAGIKW